jgi:hypothetical protein
MTMESDKASIDADGASRAKITIKLYDNNGELVPDNMNVVVSQNSYYPNPGKFYAGDQNGTELILPTSDGKVVARYGDVPVDSLSRHVQLKAECVQSTGSTSTNLSINLVKPNTITGTVYDSTMRPVPYADVYLSRWNGVSKYEGYNSTEYGNATDGSGKADANGTYRFTVMPAGDYMVTARESSFNNSTRVQVIQGTYYQNIILPMNRGSIKGYVSDSAGAMVAGVKVTLYRVYEGKLSQMAVNVSNSEGHFSFDDTWYGKYDLQATTGDETADLPLVLDSPRTTAAMSLRKAYVPNQTQNQTPGANTTQINATPGASLKPTYPGNISGKTVTPKPPTPTPFPITPENLLKTYGLAIVAMALFCGAVVYGVLRLKPKE